MTHQLCWHVSRLQHQKPAAQQHEVCGTPLTLRIGMEAAVQNSADLLLLAKKLSSLLGKAGQAVVQKLSQANCQWDHWPADRCSTQSAHPPRWVLVLACQHSSLCTNMAREKLAECMPAE